MQQAALRLDAGLRSTECLIGPETSYPIEAARYGYSDPSCSADAAAAFVERLQAFNTSWTFNAAAVVEDRGPVLYVIPRNPSLHPSGWPAQFGFMEMMGVGVVSCTGFINRVLGREFTRVDWECALASLRLPSVRRLL